MKIWLDAQLSPSLALWLSRKFKLEVAAVRDLGLRNADDREIFDAARKADVLVVTKDRDFVDPLERYGPPPKVVWVTCGNTSNARMRSVLATECALIGRKRHREEIERSRTAAMAIYHFTAKVISRSKGRSAVAAAAYRSASQIHDYRQDLTFDYAAKPDVIVSEILAPKEAPEWVQNRELLWNAVEAGEKRRDSQVAREVEFALPEELTKSEAIALAREFVEREFVARGMVADLNVHWDQGNPHSHIMLSPANRLEFLSSTTRSPYGGCRKCASSS